ncbi:MAG: sulfatase-like hydrolase/transferase [Thermodesulfobacteriota bacterium]
MKPEVTAEDRARVLRIYFCSTFVVVLVLCSGYLRQIDLVDSWTVLFALFAYLSYGAFYLLPSALITGAVNWLLKKWDSRKEIAARWSHNTVYVTAVVTTSATTIFLFVDQLVFRFFNFHINGFVWNLIATPGGIESMGGEDTSTLTYALMMSGFVFLQITLIAVIHRLWRSGRLARSLFFCFSRRSMLVVIVSMALIQSLMYGVSNLQNRLPVLNAAWVFPLYQPLTFKSLAKRLGVEVKKAPDVGGELEGGRLAYPLAALKGAKPEKPLNIVWLVGESWRADMLNPEIMPATSAFAGKSLSFTNHYSGGIGTRMGMFTMFYGLYGPYWFRFLDERRSPVLMDTLQAQGYQLSMYTSAVFTYPEFDKTIFSGVPAESLHEENEGQGWQRDRKNVGEMLSFINGRDPARPFMTFMFFESPHARYYFPEEDAIRKDYLEGFNYATMDLERDIGLIFNRYVNSCHHLDSQIARVLDFLGREGLLDSTLVIITGDHGEEFLEKGHWGHNSNFTEEQLRVPLILHVPGREPGTVTRLTSHLDLPATVMKLIGVTSPPHLYSQGYDLLSGAERPFAIAADWTRISYIDRQFKAVFPFSSKGVSQSRFTTKDDVPLADPDIFWKDHKDVVVNAMKALGTFQQTAKK